MSDMLPPPSTHPLLDLGGLLFLLLPVAALGWGMWKAFRKNRSV